MEGGVGVQIVNRDSGSAHLAQPAKYRRVYAQRGIPGGISKKDEEENTVIVNGVIVIDSGKLGKLDGLMTWSSKTQIQTDRQKPGSVSADEAFVCFN